MRGPVSVFGWNQMFDLLDRDDGRSVDALESGWVQHRAQTSQRFPDHVTARGRVPNHIIFGHLDPPDRHHRSRKNQHRQVIEKRLTVVNPFVT